MDNRGIIAVEYAVELGGLKLSIDTIIAAKELGFFGHEFGVRGERVLLALFGLSVEIGGKLAIGICKGGGKGDIDSAKLGGFDIAGIGRDDIADTIDTGG